MSARATQRPLYTGQTQTGGIHLKTILKILCALLGILALFYLGLLVTAWM